METRVCIELLDFRLQDQVLDSEGLHARKDHESLMEKFRNKLKPRKRFNWENFEMMEQIDFTLYGKPKNVQICYEYGLILINVRDRILLFDLESRSFVRSILFDSYVVWFCLRGFELYICFLHSVFKFNLKLLLDGEQKGEEDLIVDKNHRALVWAYLKIFQHVWGINVFDNIVYVCDYFDVLTCIDAMTGLTVKINTPDFEFLDNIEFSHEGEMFVCKRYFIEKLVRDTEGWKSVKKIGPHIKGLSPTEYLSRPYSMFFEKSSQLLFVSDADRMMFVLDRDLNLVRQILNYDWDSNCGIFINEQTQELFLCDSRRKRLLIYN